MIKPQAAYVNVRKHLLREIIGCDSVLLVPDFLKDDGWERLESRRAFLFVCFISCVLSSKDQPL